LHSAAPVDDANIDVQARTRLNPNLICAVTRPVMRGCIQLERARTQL
jgi:hypothetical protein